MSDTTKYKTKLSSQNENAIMEKDLNVRGTSVWSTRFSTPPNIINYFDRVIS
jgi:hypothetical protein